MVSWSSEGIGQEPGLIATEVFIELDGDTELASGLGIGLWRHSLDTLHKEFKHFLVLECRHNVCAHFSHQQVPLLVLKRVVETRFGATKHLLDKRSSFFNLSVRHLHHGLTSKGVWNLNILLSRLPFALDQVVALCLWPQVVWVYRGEGFEVGDRPRL